MAFTSPADSEDDSYVMVHPDGKHSTSSPDYFAAICAEVDNLSAGLRTVSLEIHDNPELQYKEFHAHKVLTEYLARQPGWTVTPSAYGLATAFVAVFDSDRKGAVVSFNAEYEGGGGKIKLLNAGAYTNVDISLIAHPGISPDAALVRTAAYFAFKAEYFGKEAHAAARPWEGINALDALITAYNATSVLRQQTEPGDIIQGMITNGGLRPNIIHAYSAGRFVVRSSSRARVEALKTRVFACFEAGPTATGARLKLTPGGSYADHVPNHALGRSYEKYFNCLDGDIVEGDLDILRSATSASTDQGDISYAILSIQPSCWIRSEDDTGKQLGGPHTPDFEKAARTEEAHGLAMRVAKALAATAVDVLTRPELLAEVKREFDETKLVDELPRGADHW
ncbi:hypothetical protein LTR73_004502 [Friedmanniomyces endolithicus]|nr:hypothetical protein LTR73_004502 [Friedmanniomyces endolithicus]